MEKRLITFLLLASLVMLGYAQLQLVLNPPVDEVANVDDADDIADGAQADENPAGRDDQDAPQDESSTDADQPPADPDADAPQEGDTSNDNGDGDSTSDDARDDASESATDISEQHYVIGSLDPASPYNMAVYLTNQGAAIERIQLNNPRYQDLDRKHGWLGELRLTDSILGGCEVGLVAPGTPAELAEASSGSQDNGLRAATDKTSADRIIQFDGIDVPDSASLDLQLQSMSPGQVVEITVIRSLPSGGEKNVQLTAKLQRRPLSVVAPESHLEEGVTQFDQLSFMWTLGRIGDAQTGLHKDEISGIPSFRKSNWESEYLPATDSQGEGYEFRRRLSSSELEAIGIDGQLMLVRRYRLRMVDRDDETDKLGKAGYGISMELEIRNTGKTDQRVAYQLDGPTGLPLEGWWYSYKVHPRRFGLAGARDVVWREVDGAHELFLCSEITENAADPAAKNTVTPLTDAAKISQLTYTGGDAQYFSVVLLPDRKDDSSADSFQFSKVVALAVGPLDEERKKRTDTTVRLTSRDIALAAGESYHEDYTIFAGPKKKQILAEYGLSECIVYGWFGPVAKIMSMFLHGFYFVCRSWGISIIMLTVMVRGMLYPLGRRVAMNAQKMQELAPEMKKIAEKYADDLEKKSQAQRELFAKNNYNPFAGCLVMFLQFPIFVGLYRALSVDISLRQAPFLPGMTWCSNLAGPDMFWNWEAYLPAALSATTGWLGPYLNILPIISTVFMVMQQKMFTPPPQDEQQEMQQKIMKFMFLFMTVLFFKIAAGLCIYFIASSIWGITERTMLPKTTTAKPSAGNDGNGAANKPKSSWRLGATNDNDTPAAARKKKKKNKRKRK